MSDSQELDARFGDSAARALRSPHPGQATQVEQARAIAEVRAAVMIAMDRPRDQTGAIAQMREVCGIQALADRAFFRVRRGAEHVNGESIHLARELARCWGNIAYGVKELARDDNAGQSELLAFAWDLQTNARSEITFIIPHIRGSGEKRKRLLGTQEIYENNASFAGRRLREAIFAVLPVWFKSEAAEICHKTLEGGGGKPLVQRIADLRAAFEAVGVSVKQLEEKRGRRVDNFLPEDVGALRVIYGSLKRGEITISEEFLSDEQSAPTRAGSKLDALEQAAVATSGEPAVEHGSTGPHSPADTGNDATSPQTPGKANARDESRPLHAASGPIPPAGDAIADLVGGEARPAYPLRRYHARLPETANSDDWTAWERALYAMIESGDPVKEISRDNRDNIEIFEQVDAMRHNRLARALGAK